MEQSVICEKGPDPSGPEEEMEGRYFGIKRFELIPLVTGWRDKRGKGTSSVTLVRTPTSTVVVDTGAKLAEEEIRRNMSARGVKAERVNVLVTTCNDEMHSGNDHLFIHALQHLRQNEGSSFHSRTVRRISIATKVHWIDRYLQIRTLRLPGYEGLALFVHFPKALEILEPLTRPFAGKVVGIVGDAVVSADEPAVVKALGEARSACPGGLERPRDINSVTDLLLYCDTVVPTFGPMFPTR